MIHKTDRVALLINRANALVNLSNHPDWRVFMEALSDEGMIIKSKWHNCGSDRDGAVLQGESRHNHFVKNIAAIYIQRAENAKRSKEAAITSDNT